MLCEICGKNAATTHIRTVVNGKIYEKHICAFCAANESYGDIKSNNLSELLSLMLGESNLHFKKNEVMRCKCCGSSYSDIADSGKCGCAECYSVFYEQLLPYIKRVHGSTEHMGKTLEKTPCEQNKIQEKLDELRAQLNQLIKDEKYEQAAIVRDEIKKMKEGAL